MAFAGAEERIYLKRSTSSFQVELGRGFISFFQVTSNGLYLTSKLQTNKVYHYIGADIVS